MNLRSRPLDAAPVWLRIVSVLCLFSSQALASQTYGAPLPQSQTAAPCEVPGKNWDVVDPTRTGWSKEKLDSAHQYADSIHSDGVMIVQNGKVVEQWGNVARKLTTFSVRKSLISSLYGVYSAKGVINIDKTLEQIGFNDSPDPLTDAERQARIVDLLRARSGIYHPSGFELDFQKKAARPAAAMPPAPSGSTTTGTTTPSAESSKNSPAKRSAPPSPKASRIRFTCRISVPPTSTMSEVLSPSIPPTCSR